MANKILEKIILRREMKFFLKKVSKKFGGMK